MNNASRTARIQRTVSVVVRYAIDVEHAVSVLMAEFGFDETFVALAQIDDNPVAHRAMWSALALQFDVVTTELPAGDLDPF